MGMIYRLRRANDAQLERLCRHPRLIESFLYDEAREEAVIRTGLWDKLASSFAFTRSESVTSDAREEGDEIDLDKSWHVMHYLLTGEELGTESPLSLIQQDYPSIGDIDIGWGPAFAINAATMAAFARAAAPIEFSRFRYRFDPDAMSAVDIYLGGAFESNDDVGFAYVEGYFEILRDFSTDCAQRNCGAVGTIS